MGPPSTGRNAAERTICVIGPDAFIRPYLRRIPEAASWRFVEVLAEPEMQPPSGRIDFDGLYARACEVIDALPERPDAVIGHMDFPVTALVSLLAKRHGLRAATPEAVARCEHKHWMRREQRAVLPDETPQTVAVNPFEPEAAQAAAPDFPFWLKPVKGHSSLLGFRVKDAGDFDRALHRCRQFIHRYGEPFDRFLDHLDPQAGAPEGVGGDHALIETLIDADRQFTIEGYVRDGETVAYGAVGSLRGGPEGTSLSAYLYPGDLPDEVVARARDRVGAVLARMEYDNHPFNAEFFWNPGTGALNLLEINTRISRSHSPLFEMVDGASHHRQIIHLALGETPPAPAREGPDAVAAKFMVRSFEEDGIVARMPSEAELEDLRRLLPDLAVKPLVREGDRLSALPDQDSFSFELMDLFMGGDSPQVLMDAYRRCRESLRLHIQPMPRETE